MDEHLVKEAYDAYMRSLGYRDRQGPLMPSWDHLSMAQRDAWYAVVQAITSVIEDTLMDQIIEQGRAALSSVWRR